MLNILLVDDESAARKKLRRLLSEVRETLIIEEACNGIEAIKKINEFSPDLIFLDIQMPGMSGLDVLCHFPDREFNIAFQTGYEEFAVKAFGQNVIDYLLKPIDRRRFEKFWQKFLSNYKPNSVRTMGSIGFD
jgi:two-component system LytT family response regulator